MAIKKYSKVKFTLRKELIFILAAIVVLVVATILLNLPNEKEKFLKKWQEAGSSVTEYKLYEEIDFAGLKEVLNNTDGYTFVLFATTNADGVSYFDKALSYSTLDDYNVTKVYLVDSAFAIGEREEGNDLDKLLAEYEKDFKDAEGDTIKLDNNPNFWVFKGNVLVDSADKYTGVDHALSQLFSYGANK